MTISTILLVHRGLGKQPPMIRYLRCLAQIKHGPASAGERVMRRWLDRHRSIGRGDWDAVLPYVLGLTDDTPSPPATESSPKAG